MRFYVLLLLSLLIGCKNPVNTKNSPEKHTHDHDKHQHGSLDVLTFGEQVAIPTLDFTITPDLVSGWNIFIQSENFRFSPEVVNQNAKPGTGHAHLFVDGFKMARIYSNWYHLKRLTPGEHQVTITLNANDHSQWAYQGKIISVTKVITQIQTRK